MNDQNKSRPSIFALVAAIFIILALIIGWHLLFPLLGLSLAALTTSAWSFVIATIGVLSIAILLLVLFTGMGVFILGLFAFVWALLAILLFPILFPIIAPLMVILLFIRFLARRKTKV